MPQVNPKVKKAFIISMSILGTYFILYLIGYFILSHTNLQYQGYMSMAAFWSFILMILLPLVYLNYRTFLKVKETEKIVLLLFSIFLIGIVLAVSCAGLNFHGVSECTIEDGTNQKIERISLVGMHHTKVEYFSPVTPFFMQKTGEKEYEGSSYHISNLIASS